MKRIKIFLNVLPAAALALAFATLTLPSMVHADSHAAMADHGTLHVTKDPNCGCCSGWVALAREQGYDVEVTNTDDISVVKIDTDIPSTLWACHTAMIDGYIVEGHVPFEALAKLLKNRPDIAGIAVAGMPFGSPGMGNDPNARYDVIAFGGNASEGDVFYQAGL